MSARGMMTALALLGATPGAAQDPKLVPDVSVGAIEIQYSFTGAELLLFGAILDPAARGRRSGSDIIIVLKGPTRPAIVRQKRRVLGVWANAEAQRFRTVPGFYAIGSSRPIGAILDERTAAIYELGLDNLGMSPVGPLSPAKLATFERGLVDLKRRQGLFVEDPRAVAIRDGVLYRARLAVPARVPVGPYTAETYLVSGGRVIAVATTAVTIRKTGFERFVARAAQRNGVAYGLAAIALSVALGWAAGWAFRRRA